MSSPSRFVMMPSPQRNEWLDHRQNLFPNFLCRQNPVIDGLRNHPVRVSSHVPNVELSSRPLMITMYLFAQIKRAQLTPFPGLEVLRHSLELSVQLALIGERGKLTKKAADLFAVWFS